MALLEGSVIQVDENAVQVSLEGETPDGAQFELGQGTGDTVLREAPADEPAQPVADVTMLLREIQDTFSVVGGRPL